MIRSGGIDLQNQSWDEDQNMILTNSRKIEIKVA